MSQGTGQIVRPGIHFIDDRSRCRCLQQPVDTCTFDLNDNLGNIIARNDKLTDKTLEVVYDALLTRDGVAVVHALLIDFPLQLAHEFLRAADETFKTILQCKEVTVNFIGIQFGGA